MAFSFQPQQSLTGQQNMQLNGQQQQQVQPLFPQPQGNVYNINSTLEVANVPCGAGVSIALCLPENVMYIKTMQNGNPLFYPYKIIPFTNEQQQQEEKNTVPTIETLQEQLNTCIEKISAIEARFKKTEKKGEDWAL